MLDLTHVYDWKLMPQNPKAPGFGAWYLIMNINQWKVKGVLAELKLINFDIGNLVVMEYQPYTNCLKLIT